jgi:alpha 1,2-mannosyltransferase
MLINAPQCIPKAVRLGAILAFLLTCGYYFLPREYEVQPAFVQVPTSQVKNITETSSAFSASAVDFWHELTSALNSAAPQCDPLRLQSEHQNHAGGRVSRLKATNKTEERFVNFTNQDETALLRAHYLMRRSAQRLAPKLPFSEGTIGIVTTTNSESLPAFLVSLRMLRRTGCNLPVEVFIDNWTNYDTTTCDIALPSLHARCIVLSNIYDQSTTASKPEHFQYNVLSILFSSYQNVLYLDPDAFPVYDPTVLFITPPYTTHGLVTWPDFSSSSISPHYYHIAGITPGTTIGGLPSTTSGMLMLNKNIHRQSLLMMIYYAQFGPSHYFPLLSQPSSGNEIFVAAALSTHLPYYQVFNPAFALGRQWNHTFRSTGSAHADSGIDFEYGVPASSHIHPFTHWQKEDLSHPDPAVEKQLNISRHSPSIPKPAFLHLNILPMNPAKLLLNKSDITFDVDGTPQRMWGLREDVEKMLGFDVERRLWDVVAEEACRLDQGSEKCKRVRVYVREVFGWMDSVPRPW